MLNWTALALSWPTPRGQIYALADLCTHAECPLSEGELDGEELVCPCHGSRFNVKTGEVLSLPANEPLATYNVSIDGSDVLIAPAG